jgi:hypothetical protein
MPEIFLDGSPSLIPRYFEKYLVEVSNEKPFWMNRKDIKRKILRIREVNMCLSFFCIVTKKYH